MTKDNNLLGRFNLLLPPAAAIQRCAAHWLASLPPPRLRPPSSPYE
jgi:hypothetical protein